ncbi:MAG: hypothetical protein ACRDA3_16175, partial [Peptostreptococcaceae bacterium]
IWSGIQAMPKVINNVQIAQAKIDEAQILYNSDEKITKLNIDSKVSSVSIRKHDKPNVLVERRGNKENSNITTEGGNKELIIKEEQKSTIKETKNVDDIVRYFIDELYSPYQSEIIVYLPEKVNADIKTEHNGFVVLDDVFLDTLNYETSSGYISFNVDIKLENLNIKSSSDVSLSRSEISGIKNIKIASRTVNIHDGNFVEDETKLPENIEIKTTEQYDTSYIASNTPVAKNLVIDSPATVVIDLPIVDYKFNFDIKSSRGISFEASEMNYEKYNNTAVEKYFKDINSEDYEEDRDLVKELKGLINEEVKDNENEYFVKVKSGYTTFN